MPHQIYDYDGPPRVSYKGHIFYEEDIVRDNYDIHDDATTNQLDIVISGGSMGGLFTAHALRKAGHNVRVFEKTSQGEMKGRGAGIVIHPELLHYIERHGLANRDEVMLTLDSLEYIDKDGSTLADFDYQFFATSWDTTYRALRHALPEEWYQMDRRVVDVTQDKEGVTVSFEDGNAVQGDLLIVAEGYRSSTREQFLPDVDLEYAGYIAWRGIASERELPSDLVNRLRDKFVYYHGPDTHILSYAVPSPEGSTNQGDRRINLVWYQNISRDEELNDLLLDKNGVQREGSLPPGKMREEVRQRHIEAAEETAPDVFIRLFEAYDEPYIQTIHDLAIPRMVFDRTCIIGDAAFFIRPHIAAGTSHAAADGFALAEVLSDFDDLNNALRAWENTQLELGQRLVNQARKRGDQYMNHCNQVFND